VIHGLRINGARIKKISGDEDEINPLADGMARDNIEPRAGEVFGALVQIVTATTEMRVSEMEKLHRKSSGKRCLVKPVKAAI